MDSLFHSLVSILGIKKFQHIHISNYIKNPNKKIFSFLFYFLSFSWQPNSATNTKKGHLKLKTFPRKKKTFLYNGLSCEKNFLLYQQRSFLLLVFFFFLESLRWQLLLRSWPMHRQWLPCRLLPPPMLPKIGPSSFTVIFFSTTSSQNGNQKSKLSFSSSDSHFCVYFCFYSDSDWFLWRSNSTSLAEIIGLIFDFGVLWRRSTSFSGKKLWFFFFFYCIFVFCILFHIFMRFCVEKNSERSERERASEREKCLEAEKLKENENPKTLKCLNYGKGWVELG